MDKEQIERLVEEIKTSGSLEGFGMVIEQLQQPIFTYCYHMLGHRQEAEDAVQEVFIKAYENLEKYTEVVPFLNNRVPADDREEGAARVDQGQLSAPLHRALSTLSPEERNLILLRVIEEKGYEELSVLFQEKPATLRKRYERAMKKCKNQLLSQKGGEMSEAFRLIR